MERLGTVKAVAFDKTGTVTEGAPTVVSLKTFDIPETELLRIAASGESYAEHPIGKAIVQYAEKELTGEIELPVDSEPIAGKGIAFTLGDTGYLLGNRALFSTYGVPFDRYEDQVIEEEKRARTVVLVGTRDRILGIIAVADTVREEAKHLVQSLKRQHVKHLVMLTGDNERTARAISEELGFDEFRAELLPEDKVAAIKELQRVYTSVAMVGDGVNDAPALAVADIGIAIGGAGSDVAMETADVVVMSSKLPMLGHALGLSRATVRNMKQNIYFAILVAATLLVGVLLRSVDLSIGMLVHELSVLLVILNAIRLLRYRK